VTTGKVKRGRSRLLPELRAWMTRTETTQDALARLLGLSGAFICRVFKGERHLNLDMAARLALLTGIPVQKLLTGGEAAQLLKLLGKQSNGPNDNGGNNTKVA
jgi:plasmid maintenance system antidote protein VapI